MNDFLGLLTHDHAFCLIYTINRGTLCASVYSFALPWDTGEVTPERAGVTMVTGKSGSFPKA